MFRSIALFEVIVVVFIGVFLWALIDAIRRPESQYPNGTGKTGWIVGIVATMFIGLSWFVAIAYLVLVRRRMGPIQATPGESPGAAPPPPPPV